MLQHRSSCFSIYVNTQDQNMVSIKGSRMIRSNTDTPGPAQYQNIYSDTILPKCSNQKNIRFLGVARL